MSQINNSYASPQPIAQADTNANVDKTNQTAQKAEGAWADVGKSAASSFTGAAGKAGSSDTPTPAANATANSGH